MMTLRSMCNLSRSPRADNCMNTLLQHCGIYEFTHRYTWLSTWKVSKKDKVRCMQYSLCFSAQYTRTSIVYNFVHTNTKQTHCRSYIHSPHTGWLWLSPNRWRGCCPRLACTHLQWQQAHVSQHLRSPGPMVPAILLVVVLCMAASSVNPATGALTFYSTNGLVLQLDTHCPGLTPTKIVHLSLNM